jgi:hypothetical protein
MEDSENRTETAADDATERGRISHIAVTLTIPVGIPRPENGRIGFYGRIRHRLRRIRLIQGRIGGGLGRIRRQGDGNAFVMGLHEFVPVGRRPAGGRDWRRFERFAQMRQDLPDRAWLGDEGDQPDVAATRWACPPVAALFCFPQLTTASAVTEPILNRQGRQFGKGRLVPSWRR